MESKPKEVTNFRRIIRSLRRFKNWHDLFTIGLACVLNALLGYQIPLVATGLTVASVANTYLIENKAYRNRYKQINDINRNTGSSNHLSWWSANKFTIAALFVGMSSLVVYFLFSGIPEQLGVSSEAATGFAIASICIATALPSLARKLDMGLLKMQLEELQIITVSPINQQEEEINLLRNRVEASEREFERANHALETSKRLLVAEQTNNDSLKQQAEIINEEKDVAIQNLRIAEGNLQELMLHLHKLRDQYDKNPITSKQSEDNAPLSDNQFQTATVMLGGESKEKNQEFSLEQS